MDPRHSLRLAAGHATERVRRARGGHAAGANPADLAGYASPNRPATRYTHTDADTIPHAATATLRPAHAHARRDTLPHRTLGARDRWLAAGASGQARRRLLGRGHQRPLR